MAYGTIKVDTVTFTNDGVDKSVTLSGLVQNPTFSGNVTVTGTISGVTVTGTTASFTSGNFTNISGGTHTITSGVFAAGSAASPSITFTGDLNTGIYSPGADQVAISTGGSGRLFVDASGNVRITSGSAWATADGNLQLSFSTNEAYATTYYDNHSITFGAGTSYKNKIRVSATGADNAITFHVGATSPNERMRITGAGLVGIGTSTPVDKLHVDGRIAVSTDSSTPTTGEAFFYKSASGAVMSGFGATIETGGAGSRQARVSVDSSGQVGIGTTSPGQSLSIVAPSTAQAIGVWNRASDNIYGGIYFKTSDGVTDQSSILNERAGTNGASLLLYTKSDGGSATERARVDSSGRLLVGTSSSPSSGNGQYARLVVQSNTAAPAGYVSIQRNEAATSINSEEEIGLIGFGDSAGNSFATINCVADADAGANDYPGRLVFSTTADGASSPTERMRITNDGNTMISSTAYASARLGIGGYTNGDRFGVYMRPSANNATAFSFNNASGTSVGSITTTASATAFNTSSDYRLKENVVAVTDGITRLQQLKPSRFNFIADPTKTVDGFLAHEAAEVVPEAITGEKDAVDDEGNPIYQGIDQSKMVPLVVAALQECIKKVEALELELALLKSKP